MSVDIAPDEITFSREPYSSMSLSRSFPCSLAVSPNFVWNSSIVTPASVICSVNLLHFEPRAPSNKLFLASADLLMELDSTSLISVQSALASSKSPMMISHVCVQPDCMASFVVSINWVNVLTFVAASSAVVDMLRSS